MRSTSRRLHLGVEKSRPRFTACREDRQDVPSPMQTKKSAALRSVLHRLARFIGREPAECLLGRKGRESLRALLRAVGSRVVFRRGLAPWRAPRPDDAPAITMRRRTRSFAEWKTRTCSRTCAGWRFRMPAKRRDRSAYRPRNAVAEIARLFLDRAQSRETQTPARLGTT